jgi:hypothetical protein
MEKTLYEERLEQGYTHVTRGTGRVYVPLDMKTQEDWGVSTERLAHVSVFYRPDGKIAINGRFKNQDATGHTVYAGFEPDPNRVFENEEELNQYLEKYQVELGEKIELETLVEPVS